jgi:LacI family transcriptional regulator
MSPRAPSINTLARTLGISRTTISDALRGKGRVAAATVERVREAARAAGYRPNPLVATVLGAIHHSRKSAFGSALAVVDILEPNHPHGPFPRELIAGARTRAAEMGFSVAEFTVGPGHLTWSRLNSILESRGTHGVILLPTWFEPEISEFDFSRYATIYTDYVSAAPELHAVCCDHYGSMLALLSRLRERGYRRPGLLLERRRDERIQHRQSAAFHSFQAAHPGLDAVPPLITAGYPDFRTEFAPWFGRHKPDIILSHFNETREWVRACSPTFSPGLVLMNTLDRKFPCAALDLQPRTLGQRAAETVIGQILRNEFGLPNAPSRTTVAARWVDGPTVRPAA